MGFKENRSFIGHKSKSDCFVFYEENNQLIIKESFFYIIMPVLVCLFFFGAISYLILQDKIGEAPVYFQIMLYIFHPCLLVIAIRRASFRKAIYIDQEKITLFLNIYFNKLHHEIDVASFYGFKVSEISRRRSTGSSFITDYILKGMQQNGEFCLVESSNKEKVDNLYKKILDMNLFTEHYY